MSTTSAALMLTIGTVLGAGFTSGINSANSNISSLNKKVNAISKTHIDIKAFKNLTKAGKEGSDEFKILSGRLDKAKVNTKQFDTHIKGLALNLNYLRNKSKLDIKITANTDKIRSEMMSLKGTIAGVAGVVALAKSAANVEQAKGEIASLGIDEKGISKISKMATDFSNNFAGANAPDIIKASYDIKSGIASLSDDGVAEFTRLAALTGIATKSSTETMTKTFALGYGVFRDQFKTDEEFGEKFSVAVSSAVQGFRTTGDDLSGSISALGAVAATKGVSMVEQFATIGVLKDTFYSASEAAVGFKGFLNGVGKAQKALGLEFTDANGKMLPKVQILEKIKAKYGDTLSDVAVQDELKEAFGSDEAVKMIGGTINKIDNLKEAQRKLAADLKNGTKTSDMAAAMQRGQGFTLLAQQMSNTGAAIGQFFLPPLLALSSLVGSAAKMITVFTEKFPTISKVIAAAALGFIAFNIAMSVGKIAVLAYQSSTLSLLKVKKFLNLQLNLASLRMKSFGITTAVSNAKLKLFNITSKIFSLTMGALSQGAGLGGKAVMFLGGTFKKVSIMMMTTPLGLILGGIALVAGLIISNWDKVKVWFRSFVDWVYPIFQPVIDFFKNLWGGIFDFFGSKFEWLTSTISWVIDKSKKVASFFGFGGENKDDETYGSDEATEYVASLTNGFDKTPDNSNDTPVISHIGKEESIKKIKSERGIAITFNGDFKIDSKDGNFDFTTFKAQLIREVKSALKQDEWNRENIAFEN